MKIVRETKETQIETSITLYGTGVSHIDTGVGFLDHMLQALSKHSGIDMRISCKGDTHIDDHHSVEDIGIVLGQGFYQSIYPISNIERYGNATVVMDEASVSCDLDISNRPFLVFELPIEGKVGSFDCELVEEFFRAFCFNASISAHVICNRGKNRHHIIEGAFKALAVALRRAMSKNQRLGVPSTKGVI